MDLDTRILVVDDFLTMRRMLQGNLRQLGFKNIELAVDGIEALEVLEEGDIDLILCDWSMPNMNGLDLLKVVRNDEELKNIPFIMITAEGRKRSVLEAIENGVTNYVMKPFSPQILCEKIEKALAT